MPWLKLIPSKKISEVFRVNSKLFRGCQWSKIDALSQPESLTLEFGSLPDGFKRSNPINLNSYFSNLSPGQRKLKPMKLFNTLWSFKANFERVWFKKNYPRNDAKIEWLWIGMGIGPDLRVPGLVRLRISKKCE